MTERTTAMAFDQDGRLSTHMRVADGLTQPLGTSVTPTDSETAKTHCRESTSTGCGKLDDDFFDDAYWDRVDRIASLASPWFEPAPITIESSATNAFTVHFDQTRETA